jgi:hypothetical protein
MIMNSHNVWVCLENEYFRFEIHQEKEEFIYSLFDKLNNIVMADMDYYYSITDEKGNVIDLLSKRTIKKEGDRIFIKGFFSEYPFSFEQIFEVRTNDRWLYENLIIKNESGKEIILNDINFGMRKMLFRQYEGWCENLDEYKLCSIPIRRFSSQMVDRRKVEYTANDLIYPKWSSSGDEQSKVLPNYSDVLPNYCEEGWVWVGKNGGLVTCKYNRTQMEFARFNRQALQLPGRGSENVAVIYGGTASFRGDPEIGLVYASGGSYQFGESKYTFFTGSFEEGYYLYRDHLEKKGHIFSKDYDPPVHWNELYNLGWFAETMGDGNFSDNPDIKLYTLEDLYQEAQNAKDAGAESLYLDPGWDLYPGSSVWDEKRLGKFKDFADTIHNKYRLKVALHLMMVFTSEKELEEFYCRNDDGSKSLGAVLDLYCFCPNDVWVHEKTARLLKLASEGADFFMFDFSFYGNRDYVGCMNPAHGHETPMRKQTHADNIMKVIHNVKKFNKSVLIEAHDRIVGGSSPYHALYFQHGDENTFDENWGYEFMWNPLSDLISKKAISLYEYNMAYSIPLYLHINEHGDNDNLLSLWWYISTVRHLGIGGLLPEEPKYKLLQSAMTLYHNYKTYFAKGTFYGLAADVHLHVNQLNGTGAICCFNLTSKPVNKCIKVSFNKYGLETNNIKAFDGIGDSLPVEFNKTDDEISFDVFIRPLSPVIIILT